MSHRSSKKRYVDKNDNLKDSVKKIICDNDSTKSGESRKSLKKSNKNKKTDNKASNFFIVDKIIGHKAKGNKNFYKVRWEGYDENEDSWEPEENLVNVADLIDEYLQSSEAGSCTSGNGKKSKSIGSYVYVPSGDLVATKTKYFDDVRDGKIDLTKNDLYSRVKTRKRLMDSNEEKGEDSEGVALISELKDIMFKSNENSNSTSSVCDNKLLSSTASSVIVKSELLEIEDDYVDDAAVSRDAECNDDEDSERRFRGTPDHDLRQLTDLPDVEMSYNDVRVSSSTSPVKLKQQTAVSPNTSTLLHLPDDNILMNVDISKSSSNDDASLFNLSVSSTTINQTMEDAAVQTTSLSNGLSIQTQTDPVTITSNPDLKRTRLLPFDPTRPKLVALVRKIEKSRKRSGPWHDVVNSETQLFFKYANQLHLQLTRSEINSELLLPDFEPDSDLASIETPDELRQCLQMDRFPLLQRALVERCQKFDWGHEYVNENGCTPIQLVVLWNNIKALQLMLDSKYGGAKGIETGTNTGSGPGLVPPLILAARLGHEHCLNLLLTASPESALPVLVSQMDRALIAAVHNNRQNTTKALLAYGAGCRDQTSCLEQISNLGNSPLVTAVKHSQAALTLAVEKSVSAHLDRLDIRLVSLMCPVRWISVWEKEFEFEFRVDHKKCSVYTSFAGTGGGRGSGGGHSPMLMLLHGYQSPVTTQYQLWSKNGPCLVSKVELNGHKQSHLTDKYFASTLWPLINGTNHVKVVFYNAESVDEYIDSPRLPLLRVAIVPVIVCPRLASSTIPLGAVTNSACASH